MYSVDIVGHLNTIFWVSTKHKTHYKPKNKYYYRTITATMKLDNYNKKTNNIRTNY